MIRIEETQERVKKMLKDFNDPIDFTNDDGEGFVLDCGDYAGVVKTWYNYEVYSIYPDLAADTNFGHIDLVANVKDEDDWYTIEDIVKDAVDSWTK